MPALVDICCVGSSLTACNAAAPNGHQWTHDVAERLRPGRSSMLRFYNHGMPGGDVHYVGLPNIARTIQLKPQFIVVEFSMNDCVYDFSQQQGSTISYLNQLKAGTPLSQIFLLIMNPVIGTSDSAVARSALSTFYQMYRDLAVSQSVGLIDSTSGWSGVTSPEIPDGVHPTTAANKARLVPAIATALGPLIP